MASGQWLAVLTRLGRQAGALLTLSRAKRCQPSVAELDIAGRFAFCYAPPISLTNSPVANLVISVISIANPRAAAASEPETTG